MNNLKRENTLENFDFSKLDKILSDELSEKYDTVHSDEEFEQNILVLEVHTLEEGIKKACDLFEVDDKEVEYKILEKSAYKVNLDEESIKIEFRKKLISGSSKIVVAKDCLSASIKSLYPRNIDGEFTDPAEIVNEIQKMGIVKGIKFNTIRNSVKSVIENMEVMNNVVVVEGEKPQSGKNAEMIGGIFEEKEELSYKSHKGFPLTSLLKLQDLEEMDEKSFPVYLLNKGEIAATTTLPTEGEKGVDIFGRDIEPDFGCKVFEAGGNIKYEFDIERVVYFAEKFGYLIDDNNTLHVVSPIWISEDELSAYFIKLPIINSFQKEFKEDDLMELVAEYNIIVDNSSDFLYLINEYLREKKDNFELIKIAVGNPPEKGQNAKIEYFFDKDIGPGKIKEDGSIDFRDIERGDTIKGNQLVAVKYLSKEGTPGFTVTGKVLPAQNGKDKILEGINNIRIVKQKEKLLYYSTIEGIVDLVGDYGISVNKDYEINGDVDFKTGNVSFDGNVHIHGSVQPGFNVIADGDVLIAGTVSNKSSVCSGGNIIVKEGIVGKDELNIKAKGTVIVPFIHGANVEADGDIIVKEYIIGSVVKTKGNVYTPALDKKTIGRGMIMNSEIYALKSVVANKIGSEVAGNTKVITGLDTEFESNVKKMQANLQMCEKGITKLSESLRVGYNDVEKLKLLLKKLNPSRQKPIIEMFKKLNELVKLRKIISKRITSLQIQVEELPLGSEIIVKDKIFPEVLIQIGNQKIKTDSELNMVKYSLHDNGKDIKITKLKS